MGHKNLLRRAPLHPQVSKFPILPNVTPRALARTRILVADSAASGIVLGIFRRVTKSAADPVYLGAAG